MDLNRSIENESGFVELPEGIKTWFLDTCAWSKIISSTDAAEKFISYFHENNLLAGLTSHTLFELSRANNLLSQIDILFSKLRHTLWLAMPYDHLFDFELLHYPAKPKIRWFPISRLFLGGKPVRNVMEHLIQDPLFVNSRQMVLDFGDDKFMSLEEFKKNFPQADGLNYTTEQAYTFARLNAISYFVKNEPLFLKRVGVRDFLPEGIPSSYSRSLLLFFKYYIHGQSPSKSDFIDYVHVSYLPYVDVYVTERNVSNVIQHIRSTGMYFVDKDILNVSQFMDMLQLV